MIEVRQARYFLALAEQLNFTRAAEQLGMSQPPLSQAIRQLERQVGAQLLNRAAGKITLTETGRVFAAECRQLIISAQRAHDVAAQAEAGRLGTLRIGAVTSALSEPLLGAMTAFRRSRPHAHLEVAEVDTPAGHQALLSREIDLAIIRLSSPTRNVTIQPWRRDHLVIAMPADHPRAAGSGPLDLASFASEPWVWLRRAISPEYHDHLISACSRAGFAPPARHLSNSITTQLAMVACGLGVTLAPSALLKPAQPAVAHRTLTDRADLIELALITRAEPPQPLVRHFLHLVSLP